MLGLKHHTVAQTFRQIVSQLARQALQGALESGDLSDRAIPQSLLENAAFGRPFTS